VRKNKHPVVISILYGYAPVLGSKPHDAVKAVRIIPALDMLGVGVGIAIGIDFLVDGAGRLGLLAVREELLYHYKYLFAQIRGQSGGLWGTAAFFRFRFR